MLILFLPERINVIINITLVSPSYLSICQSRHPALRIYRWSNANFSIEHTQRVFSHERDEM